MENIKFENVFSFFSFHKLNFSLLSLRSVVNFDDFSLLNAVNSFCDDRSKRCIQHFQWQTLCWFLIELTLNIPNFCGNFPDSKNFHTFSLSIFSLCFHPIFTASFSAESNSFFAAMSLEKSRKRSRKSFTSFPRLCARYKKLVLF